MILQWLKDGWRTSNLKRRQARTAWTQQQNGLVNKTNVTLFAKVRRFLIQSGLSKVFWAKDTTRSTYLVNMSPLSAIRFKKPIDILRFFGWLASIKQRILEPVKFKCIFMGYHKIRVANKLWRLDDVTSKVVLYRNIGFNESGEYKKTFIGSGLSTSSMQVLHGFEFEVEPLGDHTFERRQYEDAFDVAAVEKTYAHESLTFNNIVVCEVISKWKARLKDDMDARSDVYVLSNGCRKCSDDIDVYYWKYTPGAQRDRKAEVFQREEWGRQTFGCCRTQQQNEMVNETNVTLFAKVCCFLIQSGLSKVFWAKDTTRSTYLVNMSPSSTIRFKKPIDMLRFFGWLASIKQGILEPVKFKCIFLGYHKIRVANKLWRLDDVTSKIVLYRNIGFNESVEYKKTFIIGSGLGTSSMHVLHGFVFEVEPLGDHTFEVEP
nr:zinc finger, CCHC-type [Tanacetum cinerariifolium]